MTFKKIRSINLPYTRQGYIFFTCQTFYSQPPDTQDKILKLCADTGGDYCDALWLILTTLTSIRRIAIDCNVSERTLYRLRAKFYEKWDV